MQTDVPDDSLVQEAIASLGPGAKDFTLDDLATWIQQLEELCDSQDAALAPASFRIDIHGSCRSTFPAATTAQITELQTKAVKGYPPLPELHMEKMSSNKKNARGETKLRLSVDRGPVLVLLTITDLDGATHTLRAVAVDDNTTVVPFAPDELLERLRRVEAKVKPQRDQLCLPQSSASAGKKASVDVEKASAQRQADGVKYMTKRVDGQVLEYIFDSEKRTVALKSSGCCNPDCDEVDCNPAPTTYTLNIKTRAIETSNCTEVYDIIAPILKSFQENPRRQLDLSKRVATIFKEERAVHEKLATAKPGEKKRLLKELENKNAEYAKLKDLMFRTAGTGGWLDVPEKELFAIFEKAEQKGSQRVGALALRARAALEDYYKILEKLVSTSSVTKKKRLSNLLGHKEIDLDEAMNDIAVIADDSEDEHRSEEDEDVKEQNDLVIRVACRALAAFDECNTIKEELESTSSERLKKRLFKRFGRKEIDPDEAWPITPSLWASLGVAPGLNRTAVAKTKTVARSRTGSE